MPLVYKVVFFPPKHFFLHPPNIINSKAYFYDNKLCKAGFYLIII